MQAGRFQKHTTGLYNAALERGAARFPSNDPAWAMRYLREKGLHR